MGAANAPGLLHAWIPAWSPSPAHSQLAGLQPTRLSPAELPTPLLLHPGALYKHCGQEGVNVGHLQTTADSGNFKPRCFSGSKYSCLRALKSLRGCRWAPDAQLERSISAASCRRGAARLSALALWAEELLSCCGFALENAKVPSVFLFWTFLQEVAHEEILDPPGEENKKNPK